MSEGIIAKARAISGMRLTDDDYNNLIHRSTVSGVVSYLKDTPRYGKLFANVNESQVHRGQVEQLLSRDVFGIYIRLCRFMAADKGGFCYYLIKKLEMKEILSAIVHIGGKTFDEAVNLAPTYMMDHFSFDLMALVQTRSFNELLATLEDTPYCKLLRPVLLEPRQDYNGPGILARCGLALYTWYYRWALSAIKSDYKGKARDKLRELLLRQADIENILTAYRLTHYYGAGNMEVIDLLTPFYYKLTKVKLRNVLDADNSDEALMGLLEKEYFKGKVQWDGEWIDNAVRRYNLQQQFKKELRLCDNGAVALISLMNLLDTERFNLQEIIEGLRYGLSPEEIEASLVR